MSDTLTPSQAAEKAEMPVVVFEGLPTLPQSLLNTIGEYGMARTDRVSELEIQHRWLLLIVGIKDYTASVLDAQLAEMRVEVERLKGCEPKDLPAHVQVSYCPDAWDTFIYGISGNLTMNALKAIDAAIRDEDAESLFDKGPGDYILNASYFKGQYGFEGRCEIKPGWELAVESFTHLDAALAADGKDGAHGKA